MSMSRGTAICAFVLFCAPLFASGASNNAPWGSAIVIERLEMNRQKDALSFFSILSRTWPGPGVLEDIMKSPAWKAEDPALQLEFFAAAIVHWLDIKPLVLAWTAEKFNSADDLFNVAARNTSLTAMKMITLILSEKPGWLDQLVCEKKLSSKP